MFAFFQETQTPLARLSELLFLDSTKKWYSKALLHTQAITTCDPSLATAHTPGQPRSADFLRQGPGMGSIQKRALLFPRSSSHFFSLYRMFLFFLFLYQFINSFLAVLVWVSLVVASGGCFHCGVQAFTHQIVIQTSESPFLYLPK